MVTNFKPTEWPFSKLLHAGIKFLDYNDQITIELLKTTVLRIKHLSHSEVSFSSVMRNALMFYWLIKIYNKWLPSN